MTVNELVVGMSRYGDPLTLIHGDIRNYIKHQEVEDQRQDQLKFGWSGPL